MKKREKIYYLREAKYQRIGGKEKVVLTQYLCVKYILFTHTHTHNNKL